MIFHAQWFLHMDFVHKTFQDQTEIFYRLKLNNSDYRVHFKGTSTWATWVSLSRKSLP